MLKYFDHNGITSYGDDYAYASASNAREIMNMAEFGVQVKDPNHTELDDIPMLSINYGMGYNMYYIPFESLSDEMKNMIDDEGFLYSTKVVNTEFIENTLSYFKEQGSVPLKVDVDYTTDYLPHTKEVILSRVGGTVGKDGKWVVSGFGEITDPESVEILVKYMEDHLTS